MRERDWGGGDTRKAPNVLIIIIIIMAGSMLFCNNQEFGRSPTADVPMTSQERPIVAKVILCEVKTDVFIRL